MKILCKKHNSKGWRLRRRELHVCSYIGTCFMLLWSSLHSVENIPRYTTDTVGGCENLVYYLVMHAHVKPDSTVDPLWALHELHRGHFSALAL